MSQRKDLHHNIAAVLALAFAAIASDTTTSGEIVDTAGYEAIEFILSANTITDGAYAVQIWQSDDSGMAGAVQVTGDELLGDADFAATDDDTVKRIGSVGKKRYQQLRVVSAGVTTGVDIFGAVAALGAPHHAPVAD